MLVVSAFGFVDATYLTTKHYLGEPVNCSILEGCEEVTGSIYSVMFGFPVALYGSIYYLMIFILSVLYLDTKREAIINFTAKLTSVGFAASIYFIYLQVFVIKALCLYCIFSALFSTILFILGMIIINKKRLAISGE